MTNPSPRNPDIQSADFKFMIKRPVPESENNVAYAIDLKVPIEVYCKASFPVIGTSKLNNDLKKRFYRPYNLKLSNLNIDSSILQYPIWSKLKRRCCINTLDLKAINPSSKSHSNTNIITKFVRIACSIRNLNVDCPQDEGSYHQIINCVQAAASLQKTRNVCVHLNSPKCFHNNTLKDLLDLLAFTYNEGITFKMLPNDEWAKNICILSETPLASPCLKNFQVKFPPHFDNICSINNLIKMTNPSRGVEKLLVECSGTDLNDLSFIFLRDGFGAHKNLRSLKLELTGPKVNSLSISNLFDDEFSNLHLVDFSVGLYNFTNLIDEVMKKLLFALSNIHSLLNINFNLDKCSVSDNSLQNFKIVLYELENLKRFSLRVGFTIGAVTNKSIQIFTEGIRVTSKLEHYAVEFERKSGITDDGLLALAASLRRITNVKSVKFCFPGCTKLTSKGIAILGQSFSLLTRLESLVLNLESSPEIDDDGVRPLITYLKRIQRLREIKLGLKQCGVSKDVADSLSKYVNALPSGGLIMST
jgi:hypothetical protein